MTTTLTNPQAQHLEALISHGSLRGSNRFDPAAGLGHEVVLARLASRGLASHDDWNGSTYRYRATPDGAAALAAHD